jgi:hypothetical protein
LFATSYVFHNSPISYLNEFGLKLKEIRVK